MTKNVPNISVPNNSLVYALISSVSDSSKL